MPEPFKNLMSLELIQGIARELSAQWSAFDQAAFVASASHQLEDLELKARAADHRSARLSPARRLYARERCLAEQSGACRRYVCR